ncbi:MAG TPA: hypothetical protein H9879_05550, partial [Candidatus Alistipes intestinipullorum]|nr:hypothetical protein [Candidatus Alistipes intestinipullorum]
STLGGVWSLVRIQSPRLKKRLDNHMIAEPFSFLDSRCSSPDGRKPLKWLVVRCRSSDLVADSVHNASLLKNLFYICNNPNHVC